jgi:uncharacterized damage-inducible protein DinB
MNNKIAAELLRELEAEEGASRKCLERIPESLYEYKPHEKSMKMGYLTLLVAEIPKWITKTIENGEIDLAKWEKFELTTTSDLLKYFEDNLKAAKETLKNVSDESLEEMFSLKMNDAVLLSSSKKDSASSSLNHWVHHRGQLTVYMRLNNIAVPSIYGPSADDKTF